MANEQWRTCEVIEGESENRPFSIELSTASAQDAETAVDVMYRLQQLVQDMGWVKASSFYRWKGKLRVVNKGGILRELKCYPGCWRLYFYVDESQRLLVYLLAVCKKKNKEDYRSSEKANRIINTIATRENGIAFFPFPN
jgi:hypothetical protein